MHGAIICQSEAQKLISIKSIKIDACTSGAQMKNSRKGRRYLCVRMSRGCKKRDSSAVNECRMGFVGG